MNVIVDTDAGLDDLIAIGYLLSSPGINIEALCVVHGLTRVEPGANNIRRLLQLAGRNDIPVYHGQSEGIEGRTEFPASWIYECETLRSVRLPPLHESVSDSESVDAVTYLRQRISPRNSPVSILALGPLTNIALALRGLELTCISRLVVMGGAVLVPGNLKPCNPDEGVANDTAEWNIYCDPAGASEVFARTDVPQWLVSLDATNHVPLDTSFTSRYFSLESTLTLSPLGGVVADIFRFAKHHIDTGHYFAWDVLAAMALVDESVLEVRGAEVVVETRGPDVGRTRLVDWRDSSHFFVSINAHSAPFYDKFCHSFTDHARK